MASLNPFLVPNSGDRPWVDQISKTLKTQLAVTIDTPPVSIFEVPKTLKAEKLESYVPQRVGLGPNHHFHPELYYKMEQSKLTAVKRLLKPHQIHDFQQQIVEKVKQIVPVIFACYEIYLDADENTLAWLFAIDGMFLLDQLDAYFNHRFSIESNNLIMLENQIPVIVLMEIQKALSCDINLAQDFLETKFRFFCKSHSPFLLSEENIDFNRVNHLLDYMYQSIVSNETSIPLKVEPANDESDLSEKEAEVELLEAAIKFAGVIPVAQPFHQVLKKKLSGITEKTAEIKVPSISELCKTAGVKFRLSPRNEGIRNINFVEGKDRICYLPLITINTDSEVVLRNLVAYEKSMAKNSFTAYGLEITEYVDFLCGVIDTAKDVKLLREEKIIEGDLSDDDVVKLFNGMGKSLVKTRVESELRKTVGHLNKVYESTLRVWVKRLVEKQLRVSARFITFLVSISSILVLVYQVYTMVYRVNPPHMMLLHFLHSKLSLLLVSFLGPKGRHGGMPLPKH